MKKLLGLLLACVLIGSLIGCEEDGNGEVKQCTNSGCLSLCAKLTYCGAYESAEQCAETLSECKVGSNIFGPCMSMECNEFFDCYANPEDYNGIQDYNGLPRGFKPDGC